VDVEGCWRVSIHDGLLDVGWFCVRKLDNSCWRGMNVSFVVVVGESASALEDRRVCVEAV
jgi:hypothetical protein